MLEPGFQKYSETHALPAHYTTRQLESIDCVARKAILDGICMDDLCADVAKSCYRVPMQTGLIPTVTCTSKVHHFGLDEKLNSYVLMAS